MIMLQVLKLILKENEFRQTEFGRRKKVNFPDMPLYVVSQEDLLLSKLIWIQEIQNTIQMEDIKNLKQLKGLDRNYIGDCIKKLNLNTFGLV